MIGKAGAGKTTAAKIISSYYGHERIHFATALKEIAAEIWGGRVNRDILQKFGVAMREIDEDVWVRILMQKVDTEYDENSLLVGDDCRFPNEVAALLARDFVFIRITADEEIREQRLLAIGRLESHEQLHHESETAIDDFKPDVTIANNEQDKEILERQILSAMRTVIGSG